VKADYPAHCGRLTPGGCQGPIGGAGSNEETSLPLEVAMSLNHSPEMHQNIIARIPAVTGRELREWFMRLESGPPFSRCEERAHWLSDEHGLSHGYASAIVHEYEFRRRLRLNSA
jgi:hypothetical protein